jgi:ribonuclease P protein subunit POP4
MINGKCYEITGKNILGHEIIGLEVNVVKSTDKARIGTKGIVLDETQNTFVVLANKGKEKQKVVLPKRECDFEFKLGNEKIVVKGNDVTKRPEDRVKDYRN